MKKVRPPITSLFVSLALLASAGSVAAQTTTPQFPRRLIGSDTLNKVMDETLVLLGLKASLTAPSDDPSFNATGYNTYYGIGSTGGELQLEGNPASGEPTCLPTVSDGGANPGCQEISPMSRQMDSSICNDTESTDRAEGLAIAKDGIVVLTDNATHQRFSQGACPSPFPQATPNTPASGSTEPVFTDQSTGRARKSGTLASGYTIGGGLLTPSTAWKDVLRLIYTGCDNDDNWCTPNGANSGSTLLDRVTRCGSALRQEVLSSLSNVIDGSTDCSSGTCANGIRQAYRRDDASGTSQVFAEILGVRYVNASRTVMVNTGTIPPQIPAPNANHTFCDGGQYEGFWVSGLTSATNLPIGGDPITKPCTTEDDLCLASGQMGVVRAIKTPLEGALGANNFPTAQCTRGRFALVSWATVSGNSYRVCPNGKAPSGGACYLPYYQIPASQGGGRNFNCLNDQTSRSPQDSATLDGRVYNWVIRNAAGVVQRIGGGTTGSPDVAQWRQNMANLNTGFTGAAGKVFTAADFQCNQADATRLMGCLVSKTTCTLGYAGREAAYTSGETYHTGQEPLYLSGTGTWVAPTDAHTVSGTYPFARDLYINAIGGFENITSDCLARGGTAKQCQDQVSIAESFYSMTDGDATWNIIKNTGFVPYTPICRGAQGSAGCGAPTTQALSACEPL